MSPGTTSCWQVVPSNTVVTVHLGSTLACNHRPLQERPPLALPGLAASTTPQRRTRHVFRMLFLPPARARPFLDSELRRSAFPHNILNTIYHGLRTPLLFPCLCVCRASMMACRLTLAPEALPARSPAQSSSCVPYHRVPRPRRPAHATNPLVGTRYMVSPGLNADCWRLPRSSLAGQYTSGKCRARVFSDMRGVAAARVGVQRSTPRHSR